MANGYRQYRAAGGISGGGGGAPAHRGGLGGIETAPGAATRDTLLSAQTIEKEGRYNKQLFEGLARGARRPRRATAAPV